jgi:hypothetical protein
MSSQPITRNRPSGEAIAAFISPVIGLLAFSIANMVWDATRWDPARDISPLYLAIGSWIPYSNKIGPYAGKETILLVGWLGAWLFLHLLLRKRDLSVAPWAIAFVVGIAIAALLLWPPLIEALIPE